jgi:hypothetical protein
VTSLAVSFRLAIGALTPGRADMVLAGEKPHVIYSDPPWGPGNLMYWRTQNGERKRPSWPDFLGTLCDVLRTAMSAQTHVFVEMGTRWVDELAAAMAKRGLPERTRWTVAYGKPQRPNVLWYAGPGVSCEPSGMSGEAMTTHALTAVARPGELVFDPCCGKGMTARCALRLGMRFAGVELNPKRAAVARRWAERYQARTAK